VWSLLQKREIFALPKGRKNSSLLSFTYKDVLIRPIKEVPIHCWRQPYIGSKKEHIFSNLTHSGGGR